MPCWGGRPTALTDEQYQATQDVLVALYQQMVMYNLDLSGFLTRIREAEAVGPILDPTAWINGSDNLETIKRMAEGLRPAVALVQELRDAQRRRASEQG